MNIPVDALSGSPSFPIEITRLSDGRYQAVSPSTTVAPTVAPTESEAIQAHSLALYEACVRGTVFGVSNQAT